MAKLARSVFAFIDHITPLRTIEIRNIIINSVTMSTKSQGYLDKEQLQIFSPA